MSVITEQMETDITEDCRKKIAKNMIQKGFSYADIERATGIPLETIKQISKSLKQA